MSNPVQLTADGFEKLTKELEDLKSRGRREAAAAIKDAKAHGDVRENAAYDEAKLNKDRLELRIQELERMLLIAKVVKRPDGADGIAHLGSAVELEDLSLGETFEITLVGAFETDPELNRVSIASPLGSSLLEKGEGEIVEVEAPNGARKYRIAKIK